MNSDLIIWPMAGTYILAVSGGRDSMVMLDVFAKIASEKKYKLIVAHFDHSMRLDSSTDALFVEKAAEKYNLKYVGGKTKEILSGEDAARVARYSFLSKIEKQHHANGIITAHHQDDLIETSLLNLTRGTGRKGLVPFELTRPHRPFKQISRKEIEAYSEAQDIEWHEDPSNMDISNPRNFIRHELITNQQSWTDSYITLIDNLRKTNEAIDQNIIKILHSNQTSDGFSFSKSIITQFSVSELAEIIATAITNSEQPIEYDRRLIEELVIFAKSGKVGKHRPVRDVWEMHIYSESVNLRMISIPATKS